MREAPARELACLLAQPIAHRGLHACGGDGPVENSLGAARAAVAANYAIECDIRLSLDGEAMVFHDADLERLTGTPGLLAAQGASTLGRMRLRGSTDHVPTLAELLTTIDGDVPLVIEIKTGDAGDMRVVDRTLALLETYSGAVALESFHPGVVHYCRQRGATRPIGLVGPPESGGEADASALTTSDFVSWSIDHLTEIVRRHPDVLRTVWTVRTPLQQRLAEQNRAQIVFEGMVPLPTVNAVAKD